MHLDPNLIILKKKSKFAIWSQGKDQKPTNLLFCDWVLMYIYIFFFSRELLDALSSGTVESEMIEEKKSKLTQIKNVLEM